MEHKGQSTANYSCECKVVTVCQRYVQIYNYGDYIWWSMKSVEICRDQGLFLQHIDIIK